MVRSFYNEGFPVFSVTSFSCLLPFLWILRPSTLVREVHFLPSPPLLMNVLFKLCSMYVSSAGKSQSIFIYHFKFLTDNDLHKGIPFFSLERQTKPLEKIIIFSHFFYTFRDKKLSSMFLVVTKQPSFFRNLFNNF